MISESTVVHPSDPVAATGFGDRGKGGSSRIAVSAAAAPSPGKPHRPEAGSDRGKASWDESAPGKVNLQLYSLDRAMADYYLLFLYLWEDSPNVKNILHPPSRPSCRVRTHEEVSKGFFLSEFFKTIYHPLSFVFIPFVSISVHSWFQTVLFPSFPLCLCASVANLSNFSIRANSCSSVVSNQGFLNALHAGIRSGSAIRAVSGNVTFCSGAKSNQKGRRSDAAAAWLVLLDKSVHATCGWASCPSSAASITLGLVPRSVGRCFFNVFHPCSFYS